MPSPENAGTATYAKRAAAQVMQVVTFRLLNEHYAVPIGQVQEVILCRDIARSFEMPEDVVGIYNLRGSIIPIVDLRKRMGVGGEAPEGRQILVCRVRDCIVGFIVDEVIQVRRIPRAEIKPAPQSVVTKAPDHIIGIAVCEGHLTTILDIAAGYARSATSASEG